MIKMHVLIVLLRFLLFHLIPLNCWLSCHREDGVIVGGRPGFWPDETFRSVVMYDITKNERKRLAPLPYPVSEMATVKLSDDKVMIMGGANSKGKALNKVLTYKIKTQKSRMLPAMKYKRKGCVAAVVRDTVIVMGGTDEGGKDLTMYST